MHTSYLSPLQFNLVYVERHRAALTAAARDGDALAQGIINRVRDLAGGDYRVSSIELFNAECAGWRARREGQGDHAS